MRGALWPTAIEWLPGQGSNLRRLDSKSSVLPAELPGIVERTLAGAAGIPERICLRSEVAADEGDDSV